jgi:citrate synthase
VRELPTAHIVKYSVVVSASPLPYHAVTMAALKDFLPDTQSIARLLGSACGRRVLSAEEAELLEWGLVQLALDGSGPVNEVVSSYQSSLLAGADWHSAVAAAMLQTPRQWGGTIQAAISSFEEIREEYRHSDVAVFQFVDRVITSRSGEIPPLSGYVPVTAPKDPRPDRLFQLADQTDVSGETMELAKVLSDRFPIILRKPFKLSFEGALAALLCDLEIEADRIPRLLSVSALVSLIFKPTGPGV